MSKEMITERLKKKITRKCYCNNCGAVLKNFELPKDAQIKRSSGDIYTGGSTWIEFSCPVCENSISVYPTNSQMYRNYEDIERIEQKSTYEKAVKENGGIAKFPRKTEDYLQIQMLKRLGYIIDGCFALGIICSILFA